MNLAFFIENINAGITAFYNAYERDAVVKNAGWIFLFFCLFFMSGYFIYIWEKLFISECRQARDKAGKNIFSVFFESFGIVLKMIYSKNIFPRPDGRGVYLLSSSAVFMILNVLGFAVLFLGSGSRSGLLFITALLAVSGMLRSLCSYYESKYSKSPVFELGENVLAGTVFFMLAWLPSSLIFGSLNFNDIMYAQISFWQNESAANIVLAVMFLLVSVIPFTASFILIFDSPAVKTEKERQENSYLKTVVFEIMSVREHPGTLTWLNQYFYFCVMTLIMIRLYLGGVLFFNYGVYLLGAAGILLTGIFIWFRRRISAYEGKFVPDALLFISALNVVSVFIYRLFLYL